MWATIRLKIKIYKAKWLSCHCQKCVSKKWSKYHKKSNPTIPFFLLATILLTPFIEYGDRVLVFENPPIAESVAIAAPSEVIETSPVRSDPNDPDLVRGDIERLLHAICTVESNCDSSRIGDGGNSYGAFQIHLPSHPTITKEQAMTFHWAKEWTLNHCKKYLDSPEMFAACHNGIGKYPRNQWYVDRVMAVYNSTL